MLFPVISVLVGPQHPEWGPPPPVAPYGQAPPPNQRVILPMIFPVIGQSRWKNGYGDQRAGFRHTGIDIRAPKMSPIVAPFAGTLGMKRNSFWIYADNGWAMLGTHLNDDNPGKHDHAGSRDLMFAPDLVPGQRVRSGQFIGYLGESGNATAPHLHFEIYAPGDGPTMGRIRNPTPSLHMAQRIHSPVPRFVRGKPPRGNLRLRGCIRKVDAATERVTIILVSKQMPNGMTVCVSHPRYVRLKIGFGIAGRAGGFSALGELPRTLPIDVMVPATGNVDDAKASSIVIPKG